MENIPERERDWHPGSDEQVLDLVHPSLWPLVYGHSLVLKDKLLDLANCLDDWGGPDDLALVPEVSKASVDQQVSRTCSNTHGWYGMRNDQNSRIWSRRFQWLPCEVSLDGKGGAEITSYVNNLHPRRHANLYTVLNKLLAKALPLWDTVYEHANEWEKSYYRLPRTRVTCKSVSKECHSEKLCGLHYGCDEDDYLGRLQAMEENDAEDAKTEVDVDDSGDYAPDTQDSIMEDPEEDRASTGGQPPRRIAQFSGLQEPPPAPPLVFVAEPLPGDDFITDEEAFVAAHPVVQPDPNPYSAVFPTLANGGIRASPADYFGGKRNLQVIVKLANIHLTPEKPTYGGGTWHLEGQLNEHIVSTALYYYDCENITDSHLAFRTSANSEDMMMELDYEQSDEYSIRHTFGIGNGDEYGTAQVLGQVLTREGRVIAFPNVYHHQVSPFELVDKTKPGHRKIVALFLVDPKIEVISTANVPPQRQDWWLERVGKPGAAFGVPLPEEISRMVLRGVDFPVTREVALQWRTELMAERKSATGAGEQRYRYDDWNFCEH